MPCQTFFLREVQNPEGKKRLGQMRQATKLRDKFDFSDDKVHVHTRDVGGKEQGQAVTDGPAKGLTGPMLQMNVTTLMCGHGSKWSNLQRETVRNRNVQTECPKQWFG